MTIPIDEETILFFVIIAWSKNYIASFNKFDNVSHAMTALKLVKKCAARSEFCFAYFLVSVIVAVALSTQVVLVVSS